MDAPVFFPPFFLPSFLFLYFVRLSLRHFFSFSVFLCSLLFFFFIQLFFCSLLELRLSLPLWVYLSLFFFWPFFILFFLPGRLSSPTPKSANPSVESQQDKIYSPFSWRSNLCVHFSIHEPPTFAFRQPAYRLLAASPLSPNRPRPLPRRPSHT